MSAIWRNTLRSSGAGRPADADRGCAVGATRGRYCPAIAAVKRRLSRTRHRRHRLAATSRSLLDRDHPAGTVWAGADDVMALGLGGAGKIACAAWVVEQDLEDVLCLELGEDDLRLRPAERAGNPEQIEPVMRGHGVT